MSPYSAPQEVVTFIENVTREIVNPIIAVIFAAALVYFLWGLAMFILNANDSSKRVQYKQHMLWGVIGLVIMVSVFGIIQLGLRTFGVEPSDVPDELPSSFGF